MSAHVYLPRRSRALHGVPPRRRAAAPPRRAALGCARSRAPDAAGAGGGGGGGLPTSEERTAPACGWRPLRCAPRAAPPAPGSRRRGAATRTGGRRGERRARARGGAAATFRAGRGKDLFRENSTILPYYFRVSIPIRLSHARSSSLSIKRQRLSLYLVLNKAREYSGRNQTISRFLHVVEQNHGIIVSLGAGRFSG